MVRTIRPVLSSILYVTPLPVAQTAWNPTARFSELPLGRRICPATTSRPASLGVGLTGGWWAPGASQCGIVTAATTRIAPAIAAIIARRLGSRRSRCSIVGHRSSSWCRCTSVSSACRKPATIWSSFIGPSMLGCDHLHAAQELAQALQRLGGLALDGADRDAERGRRLGLGHVEAEAQHDAGSLAGRQLPQGAEQVGAWLAVPVGGRGGAARPR